MYFYLCVLVYICLVLPSASALDGKDRVRGLLEAHLIELSGWETGDYLFRFDSETDGHAVDPETYELIENSNRFTEKQTTTIRFAFDYKRDRYLFLSLNELERHLLDSNGDEIFLKEERFPSVSERVVGFVSDKEKGVHWARNGNGTPRPISEATSLDRLFFNSGVRDLRFIGLGQLDEVHQSGRLEQMTDKLLDLDRFRGSSHIGENNYRLSLMVTQNPANGEDYSHLEFDIDVNDFTPVRVKTTIQASSSLSPRMVLSDQRIEWDQINNVNVPVKIERSQRSSKKILGQRMKCQTNGEAKIHWFSLNETLNDDLFDLKNVKELSKFRELLKTPTLKSDE